MAGHFETITQEQSHELILRYEMGAQPQADFGRFLVPESDGTYSAIDNTTGNCWTETFKTRFEAVKWLCGIDREV